jgi:ribosomal protein L13E
MEALVNNKRSSSFRKGRGFSKRELKEAGLNWKTFRGKRDLMRKSCYQHNVDTLKG